MMSEENIPMTVLKYCHKSLEPCNEAY